MNTILIAVAVVFFITQSMSLKNVKTVTFRQTVLVNGFFSGLMAVGFLIICLVNGLSISLPTLLYGTLFGVLFMVTIIAYYFAMSCGPLSYTAFYFSASMMIPALAGILFWKEKISFFSITGLLLFLVAFYFINVFASKSGKKGSVKWYLLCILTLLANGSLSLVLHMQQQATASTQATELMLIAFIASCLFAFAICFGLSLFHPQPKQVRQDLQLLKKNLLPSVLIAVGTGGGNLAMTYLTTRVPNSYLFPVVQGGTMLGITLLSMILYKEKINLFGKIGIGIGLLAIVLIGL